MHVLCIYMYVHMYLCYIPIPFKAYLKKQCSEYMVKEHIYQKAKNINCPYFIWAFFDWPYNFQGKES